MLVTSSIAYSQGLGSGSTAGSDERAADDEEVGSGGGSAMVAPADPKARATWLHDKLAAAITAHPTLAAATIGAAVVDLSTGSELFAQNADKGMNLASNAKLLTSVAALSVLGGGFRWRTTVYAEKLDEATGVVEGDLYVRGRGDPMMSVADLRALALDVAAHGVRTVKGQLIIDATYFDKDYEPPHFSEQPNERASFRAPVAAFGVARSAVNVVVIAEPGANARVTLEPNAGDYVQVTKAEVATVTTGRTRIKIDVKTKPNKLEIELTGQIRAIQGSYEQRKRIDDPVRFAGEVFRKELAAAGVKITKKTIGSAAVPLAAKVVGVHESMQLSSAIREMNKLSDNYVAECVLKTLGAETRTTPGPASWADGLAAVHSYLASIGLPAGTYKAENGSGLFAATEVSPHQLVKVLAAAHADYRIGPDLVGSLPAGGMDGTLAKRWVTRDARGRVRAKTGTLGNVTTLAGYVGIDSAHLVAFAIFVNDIPVGQRGPSRAMADDMIDALVAYLAPSTR